MNSSKVSDVFISYASQDRRRVIEIVLELEASGITVWRDENEISGGENYGEEIVRGIKESKVLLLMCSGASLRSKNVKQEILLGWRYDKMYLPLLVEPMDDYPEPLQYWLDGSQWIEVLTYPTDRWLPRVLQSLASVGAHTNCSLGQAEAVTQNTGVPVILPKATRSNFEGLRELARYTDQIWPVAPNWSGSRLKRRDMGAPPEDVRHQHSRGSQVRLVIESDINGFLLLLDQGTSGKIYCLCPSDFVESTRLFAGQTCLPEKGGRYPSFTLTGPPGREHLLAIITDEPLDLDWMPESSSVPARVLTQDDIDMLIAKLHSMDANRWTALSTYFEII